MQPLQGLHHVTAVAGDPQANVDFYQQVLGQRLVKTTVNFDDPGTYHLYYGDEVGSPGTAMTFFPWRNVPQGRVGTGETSAAAYAIHPKSLGHWHARLTQRGIPVEAQHRFGADLLAFDDIGGMRLELVADEQAAPMHHWFAGPLPEEHALRGFHGVTLLVNEVERTASLLTEQMGYRPAGQEGSRYRFRADSEATGIYVDLLHRPGPRGLFGVGSIHHIAFRTPNDAQQQEYLSSLRAAGYQVTSVQDRQYFHSIYFRSPGGVLFEIATDTPGFAIDEPVAELGSSLKLPPWLEPQRSQIEDMLPPLTREMIAEKEAIGE